MGKFSRKIKDKAANRRGNSKVALNGSANGRAAINGKKATAKAPAKSARKSRSRRLAIILPDGYRPSENEPFMNERHKTYFRNKLVAWKEEIVRQNRETLHILHEDSAQHADLADRATSETDRALELRARDRQRKLIAKIDAALARIEEGTYGFCEETGEPIGLKRLDARPIATLSLEAQERHERREKVFRED
jgi:DnaK suppressor protein